MNVCIYIYLSVPSCSIWVAVQTGLRLRDALIAATFHVDALMPLTHWLFTFECCCRFLFFFVVWFWFHNIILCMYVLIYIFRFFVFLPLSAILFLFFAAAKLKFACAYLCRGYAITKTQIYIQIIHTYANVYCIFSLEDSLFVCHIFLFLERKCCFQEHLAHLFWWYVNISLEKKCVNR